MLQQGQYGRLLEPGLRKIFFETYKELPEQYSQVFKVQGSEKAIETDYRMGGFGLWEKKESAGSVKFQDPTGTQPLQYIHEEFASGFVVERKLIDDEQYGTINKMSSALSRAARATVETKSIEVLNTAFTANGFDGAPLISTTHKRLDGGGLNNLLSVAYGASAINGALTDQNLKASLVQARAQVDDAGILIQCQPKIIVVPPALEFVAKTIIGGDNISTTGNGANFNSDINVVKSRLRVVVMDYLNVATAPNAWFVIDPTVAELNFFWRTKLEFAREGDFSTMQQKYRGYMRFSAGYSDFRGIVGSKGTNAA